MKKLLDKIHSRGHWTVLIRPVRFKEERVVNILQLLEIVDSSAVHLRGWPFPTVLRRTRPSIHQHHVEQAYDAEPFVEFWQFYQSGQFIDHVALWYDWEEPQERKIEGRTFRQTELLGVGDTVFRLTEVMEFAARLAMTEAGDERMRVDISLVGLQGRTLWVESPRRAGFLDDYTTAMPQWDKWLELDRAELVAEARDKAVGLAIDLFRRFRWEPNLEALKSFQDELRRK